MNATVLLVRAIDSFFFHTFRMLNFPSYNCPVKRYLRVFQLSFAGFFVALHFFLIAYINSAVIRERLGDAFIAPVFAGGSLLAVLAFFMAPRLLRALGARGFLSLTAFLEGVSILMLIGSGGAAATVAGLFAYLALSPLIGFALDIFLEQATSEESLTGRARGIFLTATNTALVLSPVLMGAILARSSFEMVYLASIAALVVFLAAMIVPYRSFYDTTYNHANLAGMRAAFSCSDIAQTAAASLVLRVFYAFAAVYIPLHLSALGFSWPEIGLMLGIALLPFALVELPAGKLADSFYGEKELMVVGFVIIAFATALISFDLPHSFALYAAILLMTRFGAAIVEITTETHFFRSTSARDTNSITLYRMLQPLGYVLGVALAAGALLFMPLQLTFLAFGVFILLGIPAALKIRDFR